MSEQSRAAPPLDASTVHSKTILTPHIAYLRDAGGDLTIAEAIAAAAAGKYVSEGQSIPNFGVTRDAIWVRVALTNPTTETLPFVLHLDAPSLGYLDYYGDPTGTNGQPVIATGTQRPYATRALPGRAFAFPIELPPQRTTEHYLRLHSPWAIPLFLALWEPAAFYASQDQDEIAHGIVLGMMALMTVYNLLLYIALRDPMHLVLTGFGLLVAFSTATAGGYINRWVPPALVDQWPTLLALSTAGVIAAFTVVALSFLELRTRLRPAFWILIAALGAVLIGVFAALLGNYPLSYILLIAALLPILLTVFVATIVVLRQGSRMAMFLLVSQVIPIVFGVLQSVSFLGIGPRWPTLPLLVPSNSLLLLVIMSLALADRVNVLRGEADLANAALKESEERLRTYLDALPFNVQVHNAQLKPLFVNETIRATRDDLPNSWYEQDYEAWLRDVPVVYSGTDQPYPLDRLPLIRAAQGEKAHADDVALQFPDQQIAIEAWSVPLRGPEGEISAIVTAFQDITKRRAVENELASYREHLEQRVVQRTAELAALNANLGARVAELTAINEVGRSVTRVGDLGSSLNEVAHIVADVFQVRGASISLFDPAEPAVEVIVTADRAGGDLEQFAGMTFAFPPVNGVPPSLLPRVINGVEQLDGVPDALREDLRRHGIRQVLLAPLGARDRLVGAITLLNDDPAREFTADELRVAQTIAGQVATAIDTVQLIDEVRRQRDVAEALQQTATALSRNLDQQNVLGGILDQLEQVFAYEGAAVALVEGRELVIVAAKGISTCHLGRRIALDDLSANVRVLNSGMPLLIADTRHDEGWAQWDEGEVIRSWLGVPLIGGEGKIGVLSLDSTQARAFTQPQVGLLMTFADQAAIAVINARLYVRAQALAVTGERDRIARDLHDAVTQTIFSASLIASTLPARLGALSQEAQEDVAALQTLTRGALAEMRTLLLELRPEHLAEVNLEVLLPQLAQAFTGRTGVPADVDANPDPQFTPPAVIKTAFYRVAQEAFNNIAKHAKATRVIVRYSTRPGAVRLAVLDDGRGFNAQGVAPERLGVAIMQERAQVIGAKLTIDSEPGLGTHLFMVWNDEDYTQAA